MTFCHLQLRKVSENGNLITYEVISPDFNDRFKNEKMADMILDIKEKTYDFIPGKKWKDEKTVPPRRYNGDGPR